MQKILLIFGSQGFLGKGITQELSKHDYDKIYLFDRENSRVTGGDGKLISIKTGDLSKEEDVENAFAEIEQINDANYFLYSTIGGFHSGSIVETSYEDWLNMFKLNLNISFLIAKYFMKLVSSTSGGSICFTSAITSLQPGSGKAAYGTSKSALNYFVKSLAEEGKKVNLTANVIAPFALDSPENRAWVEDKNQLSKPEDLGKLTHNIFSNFTEYNGNIFEHKGSIISE